MKQVFISCMRHSIFRISLAVCILGLLMGGGAAIAKNIATRAHAADHGQLSYQSVSVSRGDTLWSVAKEHYTQEWGSLSDYLEEIKRCNALTSEEITAGSSLIVPIYVPLESIGVKSAIE